MCVLGGTTWLGGRFLGLSCSGAQYVVMQALVSFSDTSDSVLNDLQNAVVTLKKSITETSVIATRYVPLPLRPLHVDHTLSML